MTVAIGLGVWSNKLRNSASRLLCYASITTNNLTAIKIRHERRLCKLGCILGISKTVLERLGTIFDVMLRARGFAPTCMSKNGEGRIGELELFKQTHNV